MTAAIPRLPLPSSLPSIHSLSLFPFSRSSSLGSLRVNHVRQADPLIKTGPPSLLIIIVIRGSECRALGESRRDRRLLCVYVPRIDTPTCRKAYVYIYIYIRFCNPPAIPLLLIVRIFEIIKWLTRLRMNLVSSVP